MENNTVFGNTLTEPCDGEALFITTWVSPDHGHDRTNRPLILIYFYFMQLLFCNRYKKLHKVIFHPGNDHFRFRVSESAVVFNHIRIQSYFYDADKNESLVINIFFL